MQFRPRLTGASGRPDRPPHALLRSDQNAAARTAETARRFIPFNGFLLTNNGAGTPGTLRPAAAAWRQRR